MAQFPLTPENAQALAALERAGLKQRFLYYFARLSSIPRGSGNVKQVSDYCAQFAREHGLRYVQDSYYNVVIYKDAAPGYEDHPAVILQGHLDMVTVQTEDSRLDLIRDPIHLQTDGKYMWADRTSLGADDGIAVAYAMAILEADGLPHPPLEAVFTVDEETGMDGAHGLDPSLLQGRVMLNMDSEDEGRFTAGCAGGCKCRLTLHVRREAASGVLAGVQVGGLRGGHSGTMIGEGRANACQLLAGLLRRLELCGIRLVSCAGGKKDNAIPDSAAAQILLPPDEQERALKLTAAFQEELRKTYAQADPDVTAALDIAGPVTGCPALDETASRNLTDLLLELPCGLQTMMADMPLPETSANIGILTLEDEQAVVHVSIRSCVKQKCGDMAGRVEQIARAHGAESEVSGAYPPWEYRQDSPLRDLILRLYPGAEVNVIHAGLECGLFYEKLPGLDAISFGPTLEDIHTPKERFELASAVRTWEFVLKLLANL